MKKFIIKSCFLAVAFCFISSLSVNGVQPPPYCDSEIWYVQFDMYHNYECENGGILHCPVGC